jgi:hypothetical protein
MVGQTLEGVVKRRGGGAGGLVRGVALQSADMRRLRSQGSLLCTCCLVFRPALLCRHCHQHRHAGARDGCIHAGSLQCEAHTA